MSVGILARQPAPNFGGVAPLVSVFLFVEKPVGTSNSTAVQTLFSPIRILPGPLDRVQMHLQHSFLVWRLPQRNKG